MIKGSGKIKQPLVEIKKTFQHKDSKNTRKTHVNVSTVLFK